jgi:hypothetical protein
MTSQNDTHVAACRGLDACALCRMCRRRFAGQRPAGVIDPAFRVAASVSGADGMIAAVAFTCREFL